MNSLWLKNQECFIRLPCLIVSKLFLLALQWLKDGYPMDMSTGSSHITLLDTGAMLFLSVSRLDVGTYQCVAVNRVGTAQSHNATLEVACE